MILARNTQKVLVIIGFIIGILFLILPSRAQDGMMAYAVTERVDDGVKVLAYPNPSTSFLKVDVDLNGYNSLNLKITDLEGKLLISERLKSSGIYPIRMSMLNAGAYLLKVQSDDGSFSETIRITKH